jgi:predicted acyl esterase
VRTERPFLSMDDGVRIALTLHLPTEVPPPWPVVFEARPYRKDDISDSTALYRRLVDEGGLALCRADVRGTGSSEGVPESEYTQRELDDWVQMIAWLAAQDWSNGNVGMFGTSYSVFNSLQVAARRPPALKAIIPIYATDRRYTDDVHFGGGVRRCLDFLDYPMLMVAMNALPPVPSVFGEGWHEEWLRRLDATEPWELGWLEHQDEDDFWRHGSVWFEGYEAIEAATMIIAGHADGYRNMALRGYERLRGPKAVLFGPWSHMSASTSMPGPRIDHVPEMIRWWRRWLADEDNGVDREPPIRIFVRRPSAPRVDLDAFEGEWRSEPTWPPVRLREAALPLGEADPRSGDTIAIRGDVGVSGSIWCAADLPFGIPWDQRTDEGISLVFDWPILDEPLEIMGHPHLTLRVVSSATVAFLSAKLCCVHPDGVSELVTRGILNLTHRSSHATPTPLVPGEAVTVELELDVTAFVFPPGTRIRLDLAPSDFPSSWPPPQPGTLRVDVGAASLALPILDGPPVAHPPSFVPGSREAHRPEHVTWEVRDDVAERIRRVVIDHGGVRGQGSRSAFASPTENAEVFDRYRGEVGVRWDDPGDAWAVGGTTYELSWPEVTVRTESRGSLRTDRDTWSLELELEVYEDGQLLRRRTWERTLPRHLQ